MTTEIRALDHVAILVGDTSSAVAYYRDRLGLPVVAEEINETAHVRMTYLDAGNVLIQLVEPMSDESPLAPVLRERGEGIHHICFAVEDVEAAATRFSDGDAAFVWGAGGRGRASAFVPGRPRHDVLIELNEFEPGT
jgi:methylmalonyl-CoA/ethylmalonyl-CoA epimerase